jgi:hypothetical protein
MSICDGGFGDLNLCPWSLRLMLLFFRKNRVRNNLIIKNQFSLLFRIAIYEYSKWLKGPYY